MNCPHFWLIALPAGPWSKGICKLCGEEREFRNSENYYGPDTMDRAIAQAVARVGAAS